LGAEARYQTLPSALQQGKIEGESRYHRSGLVESAATDQCSGRTS
jgi:hypothetical protein